MPGKTPRILQNSLATGLFLFALVNPFNYVLADLRDLPVQDNGLQVQNPTRSFGYFVGDILIQKINLDSGIRGSDKLIPPELPSEQRINEFLYRLTPTVTLENKQRWFSIRYQIINSPIQTTTIKLPGVAFNTESNQEILLNPWSFNVGTLTDDQTTAELSPLADLKGQNLVDKRDNTGLKLSLAALLATILLWTIWWIVRHLRDTHTQPFAKARRKIKKLPVTERDTNKESWVALHHAFNDVAGKTVSAGSTDELFAAAPWLTLEKERIENFFQASSGRFFSAIETSEQIPIDALSISLHRLEKRQAKKSKQSTKPVQNKTA